MPLTVCLQAGSPLLCSFLQPEMGARLACCAPTMLIMLALGRRFVGFVLCPGEVNHFVPQEILPRWLLKVEMPHEWYMETGISPFLAMFITSSLAR